MGVKGIHLRNPGHGGHKGRSHGTSGAYQVAVRIGFPHQLLGDNVHHRKAVGYDGV